MKSAEVDTEPPNRCHGCGLDSAVDPENPAPHEMVFNVEEISEEGVVFKCSRCETRTHVSRKDETVNTVDCEDCGKPIPEDLQGFHVCWQDTRDDELDFREKIR